jgi:hypothetical protein
MLLSNRGKQKGKEKMITFWGQVALATLAVYALACWLTGPLTRYTDGDKTMRKETFIGSVSRYFVSKQCPWAAKIVKVCGGYIAFESISDWQTWRAQK